ncbi:RE1-silencing transcription factor A-like [Mytilus trossulus]|uniref:RE1-silencing transcription factor A-like n=1 Tax=Mytilus trossulus TaxID=6551 RepID=UPI003006214E
MERQHWCSFCFIPFMNESSLIAHLNIHEQQPRVPCSLCPQTFIHHSQIGYHMRYKHSDCINKKFVENSESICRKNITDITTEVESDSEWPDSSEEEETVTSSEEEECSEENYDMVNSDSESEEEPVEKNSNEINYILARNVNDASANENRESEFDLKGVKTKHVNNSDGHYGNVKSCDVSFLTKLERKKSGRQYLNVTRNIPNLEDNSKGRILQQHMNTAFLNSDYSVCSQRPSYNFSDKDTDSDLREEYHHEKTQVHTKEIVQQIQRVGSDRKNEDILDYGKNKAILSQHDVEDGDELVGANTEHELAVADEVNSPGQPVWKEAINILKDTFMKKKKRTRKKGMFASTNTVTFSKWLPDNFPVEGVMCGCGRHFKTPTSLLGHLRRKSATARKSLKLFKKNV